jgi:RNase P subunit RPR2
MELTRRLIDESFLRFKVSHGLLYAAQQSKERLDRVLKARDSSQESHEVSATPVVAEKRPAVESAKSAARIICGHCEGILFNKKAYRVWTEDDGVILLDMVVCYSCKLGAQKLGLKTQRVKDRYASKAKSYV